MVNHQMLGLENLLPECVFCTVIGCVATIITIMMCAYIWRDHKILSAASRLPVVMPTLSLLGHAHLILHGVTGMVNILLKKSAEFYATTNHSVAVVWLGFYPIIQIMGPKDIKIVLNSEQNLDKGPAADDLKIYLGNGLLIAPGSIWKTTRRHLNHLFYPRNMRLQVPYMNHCGRQLTLSLSRHVGQGQVDVLADVTCAVIQSTAGLLFGSTAQVNIQRNTHFGLLRSLDMVHQLIYKRYMKIWLWPEFIFKLLYREELLYIDRCLTNFIEEHTTATKTNKVNSKETCDKIKPSDFNGSLGLDHGEGGTEKFTLFDICEILKVNYTEFTEKDLKHEVASMLTAGTGSSKIAIASCLLALATNSHIQDKLHAEVMTVVGSPVDDVTMDHLQNMPYLDQVVKETFRKFPIAPMVPRTLSEDVKLGSCVLPAGANVYCNIVAVLSDPRIYPNPERFEPERFSAENSRDRDPFTFIPFGAGPRICIGKVYAAMTVKIMVVHIIRKFKLTSEMDINNLTYIPGAVCVSDKGYNITIETRC